MQLIYYSADGHRSWNVRSRPAIPEGMPILVEDDNAALRERLADRDTTIAELTAFRTTAVSQLAAQHEEIQRLRQQIADHSTVRVLHPGPTPAVPE